MECTRQSKREKGKGRDGAQELYGEFLAFVKQDANAKFMQKHDLPRDACADKMRLLTLVSLAHANKEVRTPLGARFQHTPYEEWRLFCLMVTDQLLISPQPIPMAF